MPLFCVEPRGGFILPTRPQKAGEGAETPCPPVESREGSVRVRFPLCHPCCWALSTQDLRLHPNCPSNSETDGKWKPDVKVLYMQSRQSARKHHLLDLQKNWGKPMLTSKTPVCPASDALPSSIQTLPTLQIPIPFPICNLVLITPVHRATPPVQISCPYFLVHCQLFILVYISCS